MKWKAGASLAAIAAVLALGPATVGGASSPAKSAAPAVDTKEVEFTISWENCDELQEGSTIEGIGTLVSSTVENVRRNGVTVVRNSALAVGTATDQAGNSYTWSYDNRFQSTSSTADPSSFSGTMVDEFLLGGDGPESLHNGFDADIAYVGSIDAPFDIIARTSFGDPIEFGPADTVAPRCDPL
jgi:hypothetical protein